MYMTNLNFRFHAVCLSFISVKTDLRAGTQLLNKKQQHTTKYDGCACINQLSSQHISCFLFACHDAYYIYFIMQ